MSSKKGVGKRSKPGNSRENGDMKKAKINGSVVTIIIPPKKTVADVTKTLVE